MAQRPPEPSAGNAPEEVEVSLPNLDLDLGDGSRTRRKSILTRLDTILDQLENANLKEEGAAPANAVYELRALGLPDPESYSPVELMAIVFQAQRPLLRPDSSLSRARAHLNYIWHQSPG
jgi:hypothetical protein